MYKMKTDMKKICNYLLPVLLSLCVVSCDNDDEEVVRMNQQDPVVTVTEISPVNGYVDTNFTIMGTNFGVVADDVEVYLGSTKLELIACEDQQLTVRVPDGASAGNISVVVYGQRVDTQLQYDVLGVPGVTAISPVYGFAGDVIAFAGHDLGVSSAYYKVLFAGKTETALLTDEPTNEGFSVKVPDGAQSGAITLTIMEKPVNVPTQFTVLQHATLDKLSATQGFAGSEVTIGGAHLNPELLADAELSGVKVLFKQGKNEPVEAELVGEPTNEAVTIKVPATLVAGTYQIAVSTSFETIEKTLDYTVLPMPEVTGLSVAAGYINAEVIISGKNFGDKAEDIQVKFGETACEAVTLNKDGHIVVNVPKGTPTGENAITLTVLGMSIDMGAHATFEVWETPEIVSVETPYVYPYGTLVKEGEEITFIGHGFGTNKDAVTVTFEGVTAPVEINSITSTTIAVNVPVGFTGGRVTMKFDGIDEPVLSDALAPLPEDGDITSYVILNSVQPFKGYGFEGAGREWDREGLHDWEKTDIKNAGGLQYPGSKTERDPNGVIALHQWGQKNNLNGKLWQKTRLPKGTYRFELDGISVGVSSGYVNATFVVCEGTSAENIPNYTNGNWNTGQAGVKGEVLMGKDHPNTKETVEVMLDKDTDLVLGFVIWANNTVWATFTSVTVHLVK